MRRKEVMKKLLSLVLAFSLLLSYVPVPAHAAELEDHDHSHETVAATSPATTVSETTVPETTEGPTQITTEAPTEAPVVTEPAVETTEAVVETTEAVVETAEAVVETTEATVEETTEATEATEETVPEETEEFLYASAEAADASVPTYISRIAVAMDQSLGDAGHDDAKGELTSKGFTVVNYNLNQGTGALAKIYMGYQTTTDPSKAITGIVFRIGKNPPDSITYGGATFYAIGSGTEPNAGDGKVDLNDTAGGDYIYTYVTRDTNYGAPLTALTVNNSSSTSGWTVATNTSGGAIDLNQEAGGKYIYLHYQRYSATIKATYYYIDANGKYASTTLTKTAKHHLDTLTGAPSVPEEFTYNGGYFTFTGNWRDDDEQTLEKEYYDQDISVSLSESGKAFRAGYLGWTQIAYDENGGSTPPDQVYYIGMAVWAHSTSITGGYVDYTMEKYNNPTHPSKCKFLGWSLDKNATTATYPDGGVIRLSGNGSIVYAVWDTTHTPGADTYTNLGIDHSYVCTDCGKTKTEAHTDANSDSLCDKCGGSTDEPAQSGGVYQISNKPELIWFMQYVNRGNKSASAIVLNDIDMGGYAWTPMAQTGLYYKTTTYSNPDNGYTGTFDGGGHVISNFKITASTTTEQTYGLFGTVSGTVKNLGLSGVSYSFPSGTVDLRAGGVVGQMLPGSTVENCFVRNSTITPGQYIVGGIAACNYGGTIENCYTYKVSTSGNVRCGNLVSDTRGDISGSDRPGAVINCYTDAARVAGTQTGNQVSGCQASVSAERFASGEITYLLNGSSSSGIWKQTVGTDDAPKFVGGTVYKVKQCDGVTDTYSNSPTSPQAHNMVNNVCTKCGFYVDGMVATVSKNGTVVSAHDTLQKAFDAAENTTEADNAVVTLLTEINTGTTPLWILGGAFTLDLNGKTIHSDTTNGQAISVELGADVTVTGNGTVVCTTSFSALCANGSGSSIVVMNGTFQSASDCAVIAYAGAEVTIHGGTFTGKEGARASNDGTVTIYDGSFNGSEYGISSYYADILTVYDGEFTGGSAGSGVGIHQSKADIHGGTFSGKRGLSVESYTSPHEVTISGGTISGGEYDIYSYNSNVTLTLAEGKTEGATFPGGITVRTTTLNAILGEGAAYWQGETMVLPADEATKIPGGDVIVKAECTHASGTKSYVNKGGNHTYTWSCCNLEVTESHTYDATTLLCVCGAVSPDAVASVTIGETVTYYTTLDGAVTAVKDTTEADEAVVTLLQSIDQDSTYQRIDSGVFTLDLNGKALSTTGTYGLYVNGSGTNVTITDSGEGGSIAAGTNGRGVYATSKSKVTISGGTVSGGWYGVEADDSTVTISGGTVSGSTISGVRASGSTVTISGGSISGNLYGVYAGSDSKITISGGTISDDIYSAGSTVTLTLGENGVGATFPGGIKVYGTTLNAILSSSAAYWAGETMLLPAENALEITDKGDITVKTACTHENGTKSYVNNGEDHTYTWSCCNLTVTEGHTYDATTLLCPCGAISPDAVAAVISGDTTTYYSVFEDAVADPAVTGSTTAATTVKLLQSTQTVSGTFVTFESGTFTLDLNGCVLTASMQLSVEGADLTITDSVGKGSITGDMSGVAILAVYSGALTLTGGAITNSNGTGIVVDIHDGELTLTGGSIDGYIDFLSLGGTITLALAEGKTEGATFPGGILADRTTLNAILGEGAAYWAGETMIVPTDDAKSITDKGDITIKAACDHSGNTNTDDGDCTTAVLCSQCNCELIPAKEEHDTSTTSISDTQHKTTCSGCNYSATEDHDTSTTSISVTQHEITCSGCDYSATEDHDLSTSSISDTQHKTTCSGCDYSVTEGHDLSTTSISDTQHEITCSECDYTYTEDHDFSTGDVCICGETTTATVEINLYLKAVDANGAVIDDELDVLLNGDRYVGTEYLDYDNPYTVNIGENTLSGWDYYPEGYNCPTEDITFTADASGNLTITSNNAKAEKVGDNWYIVVTLTGGYVVPENGYPVWVQGTQVTDDNCTDVLGDLDEGATVTYDPETNTLTLNGAAIEGDGDHGIYSTGSLNITLIGENTMDVLDAEDIYIFAEDEDTSVDLTIGGTGSLTFDGHYAQNIYLDAINAALTIKDSASITCGTQLDPNKDKAIYISSGYEGSVTIQDKATVTVYTSDEEGIYVGGEEQKLTITGGTVTAYAGQEALDANTILISGGTVTAVGGDGYEGIYADDLTISGGIVNVLGGGTGDGIEADNITITGGSVRVTNGGLIASTKDPDGNYIPGTITLGEGMAITEPTGGRLGEIDLSDYSEHEVLAVLNADGTFAQDLVITDGETAVPKVYEIHLAGIGMESGDYLAVGAEKVTDTKPTEGGYAYYKDGTLTLHDYTYSGKIARGLIATVDLKLVLEGTNSMTAADKAVYVDGTLTVSGTGALTAAGSDRGVHVDGNLTVNGGTVSASTTEEGSRAIYSSGKVTITDGEVSAICADGPTESWGVYAGYGMEVSGGKLTASGAEDGIYVSGDVTVSGGTVEVLAGGLWADTWDSENQVYIPGTITLTNVKIVEPEGGKTGEVYDEDYDQNFAAIVNADGTEAEAFVITDGKETETVYNVTFEGENVTSDGADTATHGTAYTATLTVADGYELSAENISVVSDDSDVNEVPFTYDAATGKLTIAAEDVIVDLYIAAVAKQKAAHEHIDKNTDHICDNGCEEPIGTCEDKDLDHDCDYGCDKTYGTHADSPDDKDHICDYCKNADDVLEKCSDKTGDKDHSCDVCDAENVTEHIQGEAVTEKEVEPTCTENGSYDTVVYCSECEKELSRETIPVPASGHTDKDGNYVCDVCEEDLCTEHTEETIPGKDATCTATGLADGVKCAKCGDILQEQETIPAKGHGHTEGFTYTDLDNGNHSVVCDDCDVTTVESEPHDYTADAENHKCLCGDVEAFTITWSIDGVDTAVEVDYNTVPTAPEAAKAADGTFTYDFKSWDKEIKAATEATTYTAIFVKTGWLITDDGAQYLIKDEVQYSGWTEIDGAWYYLDPETGYRAEGVARVPYPTETIDGNTYEADAESLAYAESKGETFLDKDTGLFIFGEDGKFQSSTTGMGTYLNATRYAVNGRIPWHVGMVKSGSDYYYFPGDEAIGGNILSTGDIHVSRDGSGFGAVIGGVYTFGEDGKLCKYDGITDMANGTKRYYEDAQLMIGNGLTKVGSEYIYVRSNGELVVNGEYWVATTNGAEQYKGMQSFDEDGFMIVLTDGEKTGIYQEDGSWVYYKSGLKQYNVGLTYGTFTWHYADGTTAEYTAWIYVRSNAVLAEGRYWITNTNGEKDAGFYNFDEIGKLDGQKNGIVAENDSLYYYKADQLQYNAGVIKLGENYYYVRSNGEVVNGKSYWITNVGDSGVVAKLYEFDANGVMQDPDFVTEEGIIGGYYYINGSKAYGAGLLKLSDEKGEFYIYVRSNGALATGEYWPTTTNGYDLQGLQDFGTDGKLYI